MIRKTTVVTVLMVVACVSLSSFAAVYRTSAIEAVRSKTVLSSSDLRVIDEFVENAVKDVSQTRDFTVVAADRAFLLGYTSKQGQYAQQFSESAHKHIAAALKQAATFPQDRAFKSILNVLILVDGLNDASLVDLAYNYLSDDREPIAYWAVRIATSKAVLDVVTQDPSTKQGQEVISKLKGITPKSSPEILGVISRFAVGLQGLDGEELLNSIADLRITRYEKGLVKNEIIDAGILKGLCAKIELNTSSKAMVATRFSQLYSYVIQRYAKGQAVFSRRQQQNMRSVIAEIEEKCLTKLLVDSPSRLKRALELNDVSSLMTEHDRVFGGPNTAGTLPSKLQFIYETGSTSPKRLP